MIAEDRWSDLRSEHFAAALLQLAKLAFRRRVRAGLSLEAFHDFDLHAVGWRVVAAEGEVRFYSERVLGTWLVLESAELPVARYELSGERARLAGFEADPLADFEAAIERLARRAELHAASTGGEGRPFGGHHEG